MEAGTCVCLNVSFALTPVWRSLHLVTEPAPHCLTLLLPSLQLSPLILMLLSLLTSAWTLHVVTKPARHCLALLLPSPQLSPLILNVIHASESCIAAPPRYKTRSALFNLCSPVTPALSPLYFIFPSLLNPLWPLYLATKPAQHCLTLFLPSLQLSPLKLNVILASYFCMAAPPRYNTRSALINPFAPFSPALSLVTKSARHCLTFFLPSLQLSSLYT